MKPLLLTLLLSAGMCGTARAASTGTWVIQGKSMSQLAEESARKVDAQLAREEAALLSREYQTAVTTASVEWGLCMEYVATGKGYEGQRFIDFTGEVRYYPYYCKCSKQIGYKPDGSIVWRDPRRKP